MARRHVASQGSIAVQNRTPFHLALGSRVLLILPVLYRRWANLRLFDLRDRAATWYIGTMFAGAPGVGADDAWYTTATWAELMRARSIPFGVLSGDIFKCFGEIERQLLYAFLSVAVSRCPYCQLTSVSWSPSLFAVRWRAALASLTLGLAASPKAAPSQ